MLCPFIGGKGDDACSGKNGPQRNATGIYPRELVGSGFVLLHPRKAGEVMAGFSIEDQPVIAQVFWGFRQSI